MRTKTLLLAAALSAAGLATSMAQSNVYSVNVVGYINVALNNAPGKLNLITDHLLATGGNTANNALGTGNVAYAGCVVQRIVPGTFNFESASYASIGTFAGTWGASGANEALFGGAAPGEAFFFKMPPAAATGPTNVTFVGEVQQGTLNNAIVGGGSGLQYKGTEVPQAGGLTAIHNLTPTQLQNGAQIFFWDVVNGDYGTTAGLPIYSVVGLGTKTWSPSEPAVAVGQGFVLKAVAASVSPWTRNFTVQ